MGSTITGKKNAKVVDKAMVLAITVVARNTRILEFTMVEGVQKRSQDLEGSYISSGQ